MYIMSIITLTNKQEEVVMRAVEWWNKDIKKVFTIAGLAGTGKSTIIKFITSAINLNDEQVVYSAYTGTATNVLNRKGNNNTSTIHRLMYNVVYDEKKNKFNFIKKESISKNIKLIIVDEGSMVTDSMIEELITFNVPIIMIGDPMQLPPVKGGINKYMKRPDIFLDEPLRQALDNPIIWLANEVRKKNRLRIGPIDENVMIINKKDVDYDMYTGADQILASKNITVDRINSLIRKNILNLNSPFPYVGEKLICLKNNWLEMYEDNGSQQYLTNGIIGYVENIYEYKKRLDTFELDFKPTFSSDTGIYNRLHVDALYFTDGITNDDQIYENEMYKSLILRRNIFEESHVIINKFKFGYATTVYKSQGSEYDNVLLFDEIYNKSIYHQQLYTGITRAKTNLIIAL
ncbi:ATP-dependent RecD-like DNA helicase [Listeria phage LPJP1]|nr:ATP-dependent RecD-like DNA helicase [Listeria phage LPJP1]